MKLKLLSLLIFFGLTKIIFAQKNIDFVSTEADSSIKNIVHENEIYTSWKKALENPEKVIVLKLSSEEGNDLKKIETMTNLKVLHGDFEKFKIFKRNRKTIKFSVFIYWL